MTIGLLFWILYIVGFVFQGYRLTMAWVLDNLYWFIMIGLLGWGIFGAPIK